MNGANAGAAAGKLQAKGWRAHAVQADVRSVDGVKGWSRRRSGRGL